MSSDLFHSFVSGWFTETFGAPTAAQARGWAAIREKRHTLIAAPTGSGKTLAAFLTALDDLVREGLEASLPDEVRVVYVSPLKALSTDIHKNLAEPRRGIRAFAERLGAAAPRITAAVRTGDTTQAERAAMLRKPPHILVTTPESLYLLLTADRSRHMLRTARMVIVDEIHAVIGTRRGAHLSLSLERLQHVAERALLRIGLSATQKPIEEVARFLVGTSAVDREGRAACAIVDEGHRRHMDLAVEIPASPLEAVMSHEVWNEYYDRLAEVIREHRTTLIFVNTRRLAERLARHLTDRLGDEAVTAHHGSLSKEKRLDAETRLKTGRLRALVATASLELGIDIGSVDLVCQIASPHRIATLLQRVGRSGHTVAGTPKGRIFATSRDDLVECAALVRSIRRGDLDAIVPHDAPLDVLAQQIVAESSCADCADDDLFALARRAWTYRHLARADFDAVVRMLAEGFATRRGRRAALVHRDEVNGTLRGRRGARLLAIASGGAIPEVADYRVVLEPEETLIGTVNEDFAIESMAGDVFQLGNASWRVLQVASGVVRVADARGVPPNIPFWFGEAPARSDELSAAVSDLRTEIERRLHDGTSSTDIVAWLREDTGVSEAAARQVLAYLEDGWRALGAVPSQHKLVLERFFDEAGGMQLVLHAPFGSRVNKAWGLALRKRFCREFNFELQAAATEDGLLLSLGPQHSFPLADVFRYLHPATTRDVLVQAFLDAPVFQTRWRWNANISLAVPRNRGGRKVPPQIQRMLADDLMAAVFPDAAACLENIPGDRRIPDHPLVNQTVRDCLEEAMDFAALAAILERIQRGALECVARDTPEPSVFSHEILTARPYAFLDDAPLEERRSQAVYARRATQPSSAADLGALDPAAIERVRADAQPDPRDAHELHDALLTAGFLTDREASAVRETFFAELTRTSRATRVVIEPAAGGTTAVWWVAAERLPEVSALHAYAHGDPAVSPPQARRDRTWSREGALVELLRGRLAIAGPVTGRELADVFAVPEREIEQALLTLETDGVVLRGSFTGQGSGTLEWCDRTLLARIHRLTLNRLRAEIEPVSAADYMRFLLVWQHAHPAHRLSGTDGLRSAIAALEGFELAASAWEGSVLPARMDRYEPAMLDMVCLTGEVGWARLSSAPAQLVGATPVALYLREHVDAWRGVRAAAEDERGRAESALSEPAVRVLTFLRTRGASFAHEISAACALGEDGVRRVLAELVSSGLVASDGFGGLRSVLHSSTTRQSALRWLSSTGRWSALAWTAPTRDREWMLEIQASALLRRYGVVFRRLLTRETNAAAWRDLTPVYRRLEARGEIRGGRFVSGMSGEQFATPEAVERLREVRRTAPDRRLIVLSAADPLNLTGIVTTGQRVRVASGNRIVYRDGVPLAAMEGDFITPLGDIEPEASAEVTSALAGRRLPGVLSGFVGRTAARL